MIVRGRRFATTVAMFGHFGLTMGFPGSGYESEKVVDKFIVFAHAVSKMTSRQQPLVMNGILQQQAQSIQEPQVQVLETERLISYLNEEPSWRPCCFIPQCGRYLCAPGDGCSCFPGIVLLLTCGLRPFKTTPEIFVTDHSVIALQESKQVVRSCCIRQYYTVVYAPIRRVIGTHFEVGTFGQDTFKSRMFAGT